MGYLRLGQFRKHLNHPLPEPAGALLQIQRSAEVIPAAKKHPAVRRDPKIVQETLGIVKQSPLRAHSFEKPGRKRLCDYDVAPLQRLPRPPAEVAVSSADRVAWVDRQSKMVLFS